MSLKDHKAHSLTDQEVIDLVKGKAKVVTYDQLRKVKNIDDLLKPHGAVFLLYQQQKNHGHWVALFRRENRKGNVEIEFFDSYGIFPDEQLFWTDKTVRKQLHHDYPYLTKLLYKAPRNYDLIYNEYPFQKFGKGVNTCGRWCVHRLQNKDKSLNEYVRMVKAGNGGSVKTKKTDDYVTKETLFKLAK